MVRLIGDQELSINNLTKYLYDGTLEKKIKQMMGILNERQVRQYLGSEAEALGRGGIAVISRISGKARNTIAAGIKDNHSGDDLGKRARKVGGGRKRIRDKNPEVVREIERIVSADAFGNPEKVLSYTTEWTIPHSVDTVKRLALR